MTHHGGHHHIARRLSGFALAGGTGFVIDALTLTVLTRVFGFDPFSARIVAIALASLWTWQINRNFSFGRAHDGAAREGARYAAVVLTAASVNYAVYAAVLLTVRGVLPLVALVAGTAVAMSVSFFGFDRFVFRKAERAAVRLPPSND